MLDVLHLVDLILGNPTVCGEGFYWNTAHVLLLLIVITLQRYPPVFPIQSIQENHLPVPMCLEYCSFLLTYGTVSCFIFMVRPCNDIRLWVGGWSVRRPYLHEDVNTNAVAGCISVCFRCTIDPPIDPLIIKLRGINKRLEYMDWLADLSTDLPNSLSLSLCISLSAIPLNKMRRPKIVCDLFSH